MQSTLGEGKQAEASGRKRNDGSKAADWSTSQQRQKRLQDMWLSGGQAARLWAESPEKKQERLQVGRP
jgi:hypothetical protein